MSFPYADKPNPQAKDYFESLRTKFSVKTFTSVNRVWRGCEPRGNTLFNYYWMIAFDANILPSPENLRQLKADIQRQKHLLPDDIVIGLCSIIYNECENPFFLVKLQRARIQKTSGRKPLLINYINNARQELSSDQHQSKIEQPVKLLVRDIGSNSDYTINISDYVEGQHLPRQLVQNGRRVTRQYTGRRSLCTKLFLAVRSCLSNGANHVRSLVKSLLPKKVRKEPVPFVYSHTMSPPKPSYQAVAYNYDNVEYRKKIIYHKLSDNRVLQLVRRYIPEKFGIQGRGVFHLSKCRPEMTLLEITNSLVSSGLPLDESLYEHYLEFCNSRGLVSDAASELSTWALSQR